MFGTTFYHSFNTTIDPAHGISAFKITVLRGSLSAQEFSNGGRGYPVEDVAVFLPAETAIASDGTLSVHAVVLTDAAVHNVTAVISAPSPQLGTISPAIVKSEVVFRENGNRGLYTLYTALVPPVANLRQTTLDIVARGPGSQVYLAEFQRISH